MNLKQWYDRAKPGSSYLSRGMASPFHICGLKLIEVCRTGVVFRMMKAPQNYAYIHKDVEFDLKLRDLMKATERFDHYGKLARELVFTDAVYEDWPVTVHDEEFDAHLWSIEAMAWDQQGIYNATQTEGGTP